METDQKLKRTNRIIVTTALVLMVALIILLNIIL